MSPINFWPFCDDEVFQIGLYWSWLWPLHYLLSKKTTDSMIVKDGEIAAKVKGAIMGKVNMVYG